MSTATAQAVQIVECPKCFGTGELRHFRAVKAGVCFLCAGEGTCTQAQASGWLAAQIRGDFGGRAPATPTATAPTLPTKMVAIAGFGRVMIQRCTDGGFTVTIDGEYGNMRAGFVVRNGRVVLDGVPNGLVSRQGELRAALQAALKR